MKRDERKEEKREDLTGIEATSTPLSLSRRSVLKGAIGLGVLASTGGLAMSLIAPGSAEAVVRKLPKKWDETIDVVVVGSGFAGLAAAAEGAAGWTAEGFSDTGADSGAGELHPHPMTMAAAAAILRSFMDRASSLPFIMEAAPKPFARPSAWEHATPHSPQDTIRSRTSPPPP